MLSIHRISKVLALVLLTIAVTGCSGKGGKSWKSSFPGIEADTTTLQPISENNGVSSFVVSVTAVPADTVVLDVTSADTTRVAFSVDGCATALEALRLTYDSTTWEVPQSVTVCGVNNNRVEGVVNVNVQLAVNPDATTDVGFLELVPIGASVVVQDDDTATITIDGSAVAPISEVAGKTEFSLKATAEPVGEAVVDFTSSDAGEVLLSTDNCATAAASISVTINSTNWAAPVPVQACGGGDDLVFDGNQTATISSAINTSATTDPAFLPVTLTSLTVTTLDNSKIYVRAIDGSDANSGLSPSAPLLTIQKGITEGAAHSASAGRPMEVLVAAGTYTTVSEVGAEDRINLVEGVSLIGGFSATDWTVRDPTVYVTTIQDTDLGAPVAITGPIVAPATMTRATVLDGFDLRGIAAGSTAARVIFIQDGGSPTIRNNVLTAGDAPSVNTAGIYSGSSSALIENNTIHMVTTGATDLDGIRIANSGTPTIAGNTININPGTVAAGAQGIEGAGNFTMTGNKINLTGANSPNLAGIAYYYFSGTISGNTITHTGASANLVYGIILIGGSSATMDNNIIVLGDSAGPLTGIENAKGSVTNNQITTGNTTGTGANLGISLVGLNSGMEVTGNKITIGGSTASGNIYGITSSATTGDLTIEGNAITLGDTVSGTESKAIVAGHPGWNIVIKGNKAIAGAATTDSVGIWVNGTASLVLTGNIGVGTQGAAANSYGGILNGGITTGGLVANNLFYGGNGGASYALAIDGLANYSNLLVANNTLHGGTGTPQRALLLNTGTLVNTNILNNIFISTQTCAEWTAGDLPTTMDYNNYTGCTTEVAGSTLAVGGGGLVADVALVDATVAGLLADANNWRIDATDAPSDPSGAAAGGQDLTSLALFTDDFVGVANTRTGDTIIGWSMGAYELD